MFKKTRNRILLLNMLMVSAVVIIAFVAIFTITYTQTKNENHEKLINGNITQFKLSGSVRHAEPIQDNMEISTIATRIAPDAGLSFSLLMDARSNLIDIDSMVDLQTETYEQAAVLVVAAADDTGVLSFEGRQWQYIISPISVLLEETNSSNVSFHAVPNEFKHIRFLDVTDSQKMIRSLALMLSGITLLLLTVFFFISRFFANRAVRPMKEAWEKQSRFVADASHELKTPLSVINANCGVLYGSKNETVESQLKWIDSIMRSTDRITGLTDGLLSLAGMEDIQLTLQSIPVSLSIELTDTVAEIEAVALEKGLIIRREIESDIEIESDREHVRKILCILLDNAVKYTECGESIAVSLVQEKRRIICTVRNSGEGIPPEDLPHLFDRFYRRDPARSSENGGYGLGLAIAQVIAKQLDITLTADSVQGEYTEFKLILERKLPQG